MRTYRAWWTAMTVTVTGFAVVVGWTVESPWLLLAEVAMLGTMGAAFGITWEDDPARRRGAAVTWAIRAVLLALLLTGLPPVMGAWSLLVVVGLVLLAPELVLVLARQVRKRREAAPVEHPTLGEDDLARRWRSTTIAVQSTWRTPAEVLIVVQERQRLLDEIDRRDPEGFSRWLTGGAAHDAQDH